MKLLLVDGHFMMHRARSGFDQGDFPVVYNLFRGLKALIATHAPCQAIFVTEGTPVARIEQHAAYKANRIIDEEQEPEKYTAMVKFIRQLELIKEMLPMMGMTMMRHPNYEADDLIAELAISHAAKGHEVIIASGDSDFTQLIDVPGEHIRLYHPVDKKFVQPITEYSYLVWKALRGDPTDNIDGIPGIGDKRAVKLATLHRRNQDTKEFDAALDKIPGAREIFLRNANLIVLTGIDAEEMSELQVVCREPNWPVVEELVRDRMQFTSFFKGDYWDKFKQTFDETCYVAESA
jgi:5'-3' exonuclease